MWSGLTSYVFVGTPGKIRTCDPLIRSQILYPAELRVHASVDSSFSKIDLQTFSSLVIAPAFSEAQRG